MAKNDRVGAVTPADTRAKEQASENLISTKCASVALDPIVLVLGGSACGVKALQRPSSLLVGCFFLLSFLHLEWRVGLLIVVAVGIILAAVGKETCPEECYEKSCYSYSSFDCSCPDWGGYIHCKPKSPNRVTLAGEIMLGLCGIVITVFLSRMCCCSAIVHLQQATVAMTSPPSVLTQQTKNECEEGVASKQKADNDAFMNFTVRV